MEEAGGSSPTIHMTEAFSVMTSCIHASLLTVVNA